MLLPSLLAGALAGLSSAPHCAVMCGPLCGASCAGRGRTTLALLRYQLGRTLGYGFAGGLAGGLGHGLSSFVNGTSAALAISVAMSSALLLLSWRAWRSAADTGAVQLRIGPRPARDPRTPTPTPTPTRSLFSTLGRLAPREPAIAGLLSALLPCGALVAGLVLAAATGERTAGAVTMIGFAGASALGVLSGGWLLTRMTRLRGRLWPRTIAVALSVLALLAGLRPLYQAAAAQDRAAPAAVATTPACH